MNMFGEKRVLFRSEIEVGEAVKFRALVRGDVNSLPVFAELRAGVGYFFGTALGSEQSLVAGRGIHEPEIRFVRGDFFQDQDLFVIWRPVERAPASAGQLREHTIGIGIFGDRKSVV